MKRIIQYAITGICVTIVIGVASRAIPLGDLTANAQLQRNEVALSTLSPAFVSGSNLELLPFLVHRAVSLQTPNTSETKQRRRPSPRNSSAALAEKLIGTWRLQEATTTGSPVGVGTRLKFFTGTHWCITQPDPTTGVVIFHHGGRYTLDGNKIIITRDFASERTRSLISSSGTFTIQIDGDMLKQTDPNGTYNETWRRVK